MIAAPPICHRIFSAFLLALFGSALPAAERFTVIVMPDTQRYTEGEAGSAIFHRQTQWIVEQRQALDIRAVTHLGDLVERASVEAEWKIARSAMSALERAKPPIPYGFAAGNHDDAFSRDTLFHKYFGLASGPDHGLPSFADYPWWGGHFDPKGAPDAVTCNYQIFSGSDGGWMVIHLPFLKGISKVKSLDKNAEGGVGPVADMLRWTDGILKANPDRRAILTTHAHLRDVEGKPVRGVKGESSEALIELVVAPNPNVILVLNGHELGRQAEIRQSTTVNGRAVHEMLSNYQSRSSGGDGWLRILEFAPDENQIRVRTYSPHLDQYETDENSQFVLELTPRSGGRATPRR